MSSGDVSLYGESLGSLDVANIQGLGEISASSLYSLPFGKIAPGGSCVAVELADPISGPSIFLNPEANTVVPSGGIHTFSSYSSHPCGL